MWTNFLGNNTLNSNFSLLESLSIGAPLESFKDSFIKLK